MNVIDLQLCRLLMLHCMAIGECPIDEDFEDLRARLKKADGIVMGSPIHGLAPKSIMKTFLDRLGMYKLYAGGLSDKYVVGVSGAGAAGSRKVAKELTKVVDGSFLSGRTIGTLGVSVGWGQAKDYLS